MSSEFVRTIKKTNLGGNKLTPNTDPKEPHYTNSQNDLLSDNEDVYVRNKDEYHCLTDGVKTVTSSSTGTLETENTDKNTVQIKPNLANATDIIHADDEFKIVSPAMVKRAVQEHETLTDVRSEDIYTIVNKKHIEDDNLNIYEIALDMLELYTFLVDQLKADGYITDPDEGEGETNE